VSLPPPRPSSSSNTGLASTRPVQPIVEGFELEVSKPDSSTLEVSWDDQGASTYEVWASSDPYFGPGDPGSSLVGSGPALSFSVTLGGQTFYRVRAPGAVVELSTIVGQLQHSVFPGYTKMGWCLVSEIGMWPELRADMPSAPTSASMWNPVSQTWTVTNLTFDVGEVISVYHGGTPSPNAYSAIGHVPTAEDVSITLLPGDNLVTMLPLRFGAIMASELLSVVPHGVRIGGWDAATQTTHWYPQHADFLLPPCSPVHVEVSTASPWPPPPIDEGGESTGPGGTSEGGGTGNLETFYRDADGDGFGDPAITELASVAPSGYVENSDDCDDTSTARRPGAREVCNALDDDCDATVDEVGEALEAAEASACEGLQTPAGALGLGTAIPAIGVAHSLALAEAGAGLFGGSLLFSPATAVEYLIATSATGTLELRDANGLPVSAAETAPLDGCAVPGVTHRFLLDDGISYQLVFAGATSSNVEVAVDVVPGASYFADDDSDGFGAGPAVRACEPPLGHVGEDSDCDDSSASVHPGAPDLCDGVDNDCDGQVDQGAALSTFYLDADSDGFGVAGSDVEACAPPAGYASVAGDCDDDTATIFPGATEVCDGADNDCDGTSDEGAGASFYLDLDGDGHGTPTVSQVACSAPAGYVSSADDCNDASAFSFPGAPEFCDGLDNDCDGTTDEPGVAGESTFFIDADSDGFGDSALPVSACIAPPGTSPLAGDCNDAHPGVNPAAVESCDTLDNDCDQSIDETGGEGQLSFYRDQDGDGFGNDVETVTGCMVPVGYSAVGGDCDDEDPSANFPPTCAGSTVPAPDLGNSLRVTETPPLDTSEPTSLYDQVSFLFEGPSPEQFDIQPGAFTESSLAAVYGRVFDEAGDPLSGIRVSVHGHPEFGWTQSRSDGSFDLVVAGAQSVVVVLDSEEFLETHRSATLEWNEQTSIEAVVMIRRDARVSRIMFSSTEEVHTSTRVSDVDGARGITVMFHPGTTATMVLADGSTVPLPEMHIRATEYTIGESGPNRMPAPLPEQTLYTYAFELSADEADEMGAVSVQLDPPAVAYIDDFLNWGTGSVVPSGSYSRASASWNAEPDGRTIEIMGVENGLAVLDIDGLGQAATSGQLEQLGFTASERAALARQHPPGKRLWRITIPHFTPYDLNPGGSFPLDAETPSTDTVPDIGEQSRACERDGSIIECENQVLGERVAIAGTPLTLNYRSSRVPGAANRALSVRATGSSVPDSLQSVDVIVEVAGQTIVNRLPPVADQQATLRWDGRDGFGRSVQGPHGAKLCIVYNYPSVAMAPNGSSGGSSSLPSFGNWLTSGVAISGRSSRQSRLGRCYGKGVSTGLAAVGALTRSNYHHLGGLDAALASDRLGGWTISVHHTLSRETGVVYLGNGQIQDVASREIPMLERFAGTGAITGPTTGTDARGLQFAAPSAIAADPHGAVYVASRGLVRRINPDRSVDVVAGMGGTSTGFSGDGGPAVEARLSESVVGIDVSDNGTIYIADRGNGRIRYVRPDGIINTLAGNGAGWDAGITSRGGELAHVGLGLLRDIDLSDDGGLLLVLQDAGTAGNRIKRFDLSGNLAEHVAGFPYPQFVVSSPNPPPRPLCTPGVCWRSPAYLAPTSPFDSGPEYSAQAEWAVFQNLSAISAKGGSILVSEPTRIREIEGRRIRTYRRNYHYQYAVNGGLLCDAVGCDYYEDDAYLGRDFGSDQAYGDILAVGGDNSGILAIARSSSGGRLYWIPRQRQDVADLLAGGGSRPMSPIDDFVGTRDVTIGADSRIARTPDGSVFIADPYHHYIYRLARAIPPMYRDSGVVSEDKSEIYRFDSRGRHLETRDAMTNFVRWSFDYDSSGALAAIVDGYGNEMRIERDALGTATAITSPDGRRTGLRVSEAGYLEEIVNPDSTSSAFAYDSTGRMTWTQDQRNHVSSFEYDERGRLIRDTRHTEDGIAEQSLHRTQGENNEWFSVSHTSAGGRSTTYRVEVDGEAERTRSVYFSDGTTQETSETRTTRTVTLANGVRINSRVGPDARLGPIGPGIGEAMNLGAATQLERLEVVTPSGLTQLMTFDTVFTRKCGLFDHEDCPVLPGALEALEADEIVHLAAVQGDASRVLETRYTRAHGTEPALVTTTSPMGRSVSATIDEAGSVTELRVGDLTPTRFLYDDRGRVVGVEQGESGAETRGIQIAYSSAGEVEQVTDALGHVTRYEYDPNGRLTRQVMPDLTAVTFTYDANGNLTSLTPPGRSPHVFMYDSLDQMSTYEPPASAGGGATVYSYNADRQLETVLGPDGQVVDFVYEETTGRLSDVVVPEGTYELVYDEAGRVATLRAPSGSTLAYTYDGFLVRSEVLSGEVTGALSWDFDDEFRMVAETMNGGETTSFVYDDDGYLTNAGMESLTQDSSSGLLESIALGNTVTSYSYGPDAALVGMEFEAGGVERYASTLQRDQVGRIKAKTESFDTTLTRCYVYDLRGRISHVLDGFDGTECAGTLVEEYRYDSNSNRIYALNSSGLIEESEVVTDGLDRLLQYGTLRYSYEADGTLATKEDLSTGDMWEYQYDVMGNLLHVETPSGESIEYLVDARNRRIGKRVNGSLHQAFLYRDQLNPVAELDGAGNVVSRFVYGSRGHVPDYMVRSGVTYRLVSDHLGSVVAVINVANGQIVQQREYDAWGRIVFESSEHGFSQPFGFAGGLWDEDIGLVRFGARDYEPHSGRWTSKDPVLFLGRDLNLFGYAAGDPINRIDPSGLSWHEYFNWVEDLNDSSLGQAIVGFGDTVGGIPFTNLNIARMTRSIVGGNDLVDEYSCKTAYQLGEVAGVAHLLLLNGRGFQKGYEFTRNPKLFRLAPWGNRTGHPTGRFPHYHRRKVGSDGNTIPGGSVKRHRPWDRAGTDTDFWDRF